MRRRADGEWESTRTRWGLVNARSGVPVAPLDLVTDELIEVTDWELQDFAVMIVKDLLAKDGYEIMSWQGNPSVDPSIWFVGDSKNPEWVVVRAVRYPLREAERPSNWNSIAKGCERTGIIGHVATVAFANAGPALRRTTSH